MTRKLYSSYRNRPVLCPSDPERVAQIDASLTALGASSEIEVWRELDLLSHDDMPDDLCKFALCHPTRPPVEVYLRTIHRMVMVVSIDRRRADQRAMFHGLCVPKSDAAEALVRRDLKLLTETLEARP